MTRVLAETGYTPGFAMRVPPVEACERVETSDFFREETAGQNKR